MSNANAILDLIADLYGQIRAQAQQLEAQEKQIADLTERIATTESTEP